MLLADLRLEISAATVTLVLELRLGIISESVVLVVGRLIGLTDLLDSAELVDGFEAALGVA